MFPLRTRKLIRDKQGHLNAGLGIATDWEARYVPLYAPVSGQVETWTATQGGNWIRIKTNGYKFEYAHLDTYTVSSGEIVEEGQQIAITGNTGQITDFPHLHEQIFHNEIRIDPEEYHQPITIPVALVNVKKTNISTFNSVVEEMSAGDLSVALNPVLEEIERPDEGMLTQDQAYKEVDRLDLKDRFIFLFYEPNVTSTFIATYYYPKRNCCITTVPDTGGMDGKTFTYELAHQLQKFYNENRGSKLPVQVVDKWPIYDDLVIDKLLTIRPHTKILVGEESVGNKDMELIKLDNSKDIWLVRDGKRSLVYNVSAFQLIGGNIDNVKVLTLDQFNTIPDSGLVLIGASQE